MQVSEQVIEEIQRQLQGQEDKATLSDVTRLDWAAGARVKNVEVITVWEADDGMWEVEGYDWCERFRQPDRDWESYIEHSYWTKFSALVDANAKVVAVDVIHD